MGNYGRFDALVNMYDPYGTTALAQKRLQQRAYNQGLVDQQNAGPTLTQRNEALRNAQYAHDIEANQAEDDDMRARGENDYERDLDKRGLLTTDIPFQQEVTYGDAPGTHPTTYQTGHIKVRGKADPATAALLKEAAAQGLIGGDSPWTNTAENRSALAALMEGKKADAIREQARTDALSLADKQLQAQKDMRAGDIAAAAAGSDRDFQHQMALMQAKLDAERSDPTAQLSRDLMGAEIGTKKVEMQRAQDEYLTPQQRSAQSQAQALALRAQSGDPEAYHALRLLASDPKLGVNADVYKPGVEKVLAQPQIKAELDQLASTMDSAGYSPSPGDIAAVHNHARRAIEMAGDFGPEAQQEVARIVSEHVQRPGVGGTLATAWLPVIGELRAAYRYAHRNDAANAFSDLTNASGG